MTYFKTNAENELYLDLELLEKEMGQSSDTRFLFLDCPPRVTENEMILEATTVWRPALNLFDYFCDKYKLDLDYTYCETGAGLAGRFIKDKAEGDSDKKFDYGTLEYWQTFFSFNGKLEYMEYLKDLEEAEYLEIFSQQVREVLELDKEFYQ